MADNFAATPSIDTMKAKRGGAVITASANDFESTKGVHCNVSETIICHMVGDPTGTLTTLVVTAGSAYPYEIDRLTQGTGVVPLR